MKHNFMLVDHVSVQNNGICVLKTFQLSVERRYSFSSQSMIYWLLPSSGKHLRPQRYKELIMNSISLLEVVELLLLASI